MSNNTLNAALRRLGWSERVEMMQVWADHLDQLRYGSPADRQIKPFAVSQG
jgi:hypothetical protein